MSMLLPLKRCPPCCGMLCAPQENSAVGTGDYLLGVVTLTQHWAQEAVLGSFRETSRGSAVANKVDLNSWFEDGHVRFYLQVDVAVVGSGCTGQSWVVHVHHL